MSGNRGPMVRPRGPLARGRRLCPRVRLGRQSRHDLEAEPRTRFPETTVHAEQREVFDGGPRDKGAGEVEGIQGANWLDGERTARALYHLRINVEEVPVGGRRVQSGPKAVEPSLREVVRGSCPYQDAVAFDERKVGRHHQFSPGQGRADRFACRLSEEPSQDRTGFGIEIQQAPRSASSRRSTVPGGSAWGRRG